MGVRATGRQLFRELTSVFLGTRTTAANLRQVKTAFCSSEKLKIFVNTSAGWSAKVFSTPNSI